MKFLVTALWNDGFANTEEHPTWEAAQDFIGESIGCESIVKVTVEKMDERGFLVGTYAAGSPDDSSIFEAPKDWDGSRPLT